jgi:hypothetical protein
MKQICFFFLILSFASLNTGCNKSKDFDLSGKWLRTMSTSTVNDDIIVNVNSERTVGIITYRPTTATGFAVDDVKWKGIVSQSSNSFHIMDRASDGTYVDGTIYILEGGNELLINGTIKGQTYTQKWIRKD